MFGLRLNCLNLIYETGETVIVVRGMNEERSGW